MKFASGNVDFPGNSGSPARVIGAAGSGDEQLFKAGLDLYERDNGFGIGSAWIDALMSHAAGTVAVSGAQTTKSPEQVAFERRKTRLIGAIREMMVSAPNFSGNSSAIREASALSAERFLNCLPGHAILPKVAPDGEGDVMFVWDDPAKGCIVIVEPRTLHLVSQPGTPQVRQIDSQKFLGVTIPPAIQQLIPTK